MMYSSIVLKCIISFLVCHAVEAFELRGAVLKDASVPIVLTIGCVSILILVLVLVLCGGCTPMEVGSDQHEASGGRRTHMESSNYTTGSTNVNARVLTSGTSVANDPYQQTDNAALPYPVRPQTDNSFTGYSTQPAGYQPPTGYQHPHGYQQPQGYQQAQGYQPVPTYQHQHSIPGANRHVTDEAEPPPPTYNEALGQQTQATAPSYGCVL